MDIKQVIGGVHLNMHAQMCPISYLGNSWMGCAEIWGAKKSKYVNFYRLGYGSCKMMRGFQIWSQNLNWITFEPVLGKKCQQWAKYLFDSLFGQKGVQLHLIKILRPDLESSHQSTTF